MVRRGDGGSEKGPSGHWENQSKWVGRDSEGLLGLSLDVFEQRAWTICYFRGRPESISLLYSIEKINSTWIRDFNMKDKT